MYDERETQSVELAVAVLERFEGCKLVPYNCPANVCTIGIGTTRYENGQPVRRNDPPISRARAIALAAKDLAEAQRAVRRLVRVAINAHQEAALILFTQNLGEGAFGGSTLLRKLNAGDVNGAQLEFRKWNKMRVNGVLIPARGLTIRRYAESLIFGGVAPLDAYAQAERMFPG